MSPPEHPGFSSPAVDATFARIAVVARPETRFVVMGVLRRIKARFGSTIHLFCSTAQEAEFYRSQNSPFLYDTIEHGYPLARLELPEAGNADRLFADANAWEQRLGITLNQLIMGNRHFGRGFALGGHRHPHSRQSKFATYEQIVRSYVDALDYWHRNFVERGITLVVSGAREIVAVARFLGLPYRHLSSARYLDYHFWAEDEYQDTNLFIDEWRRLAEAGANPDAGGIVEPYTAHRANASAYLRHGTFLGFAHSAGYQVARYAWWTLKRYDKRHGYYLSENVAYQYRLWRDTRFLQAPRTVGLDALAGQRFVFFPLHVEPEPALSVFSWEYFFQLGAIGSIARDLPAGVRLAVKDTLAAIGRRPRDFYEQILAHKNVVMLSTDVRGIDVVRAAAAVVTIAGTAGLEAASIGKPVVAFGRHNFWRGLPHVTTVLREEELQPALARALSPDFDHSAAARDGALFTAAIRNTCFELRGYDYVRVDRIDDQSVAKAAEALVASVACMHDRRQAA